MYNKCVKQYQYDVNKKRRKIKHLEKYEFKTIVTKYVNVFVDKKIIKSSSIEEYKTTIYKVL